jgi:hypothetical protein
MTPTYLGNMKLLEQNIVAYFCSQHYRPKAIMTSYDWAYSLSNQVVVSTFHSPLERDVLSILIKQKVPVIIMLPRRMYRRIPEQFQQALAEGRILFISLSADNVIRVGKENAHKANLYALSLAQEVVFGCVNPGSNTEKIYQKAIEIQPAKMTILNK